MKQNNPVEDWERRLAADGLAPVAPLRAVELRDSDAPAVEVESAAETIAAWQAWARGVLETDVFDEDELPPLRDAKGRYPPGVSGTVVSKAMRRRVWDLYADGKTYREIHLALGISRAAVNRAIVAVKRAVAVTKRSDACANNHVLDEANTYTAPGGRPQCLTCKRERDKLARAIAAEAPVNPHRKGARGATPQRVEVAIKAADPRVAARLLELAIECADAEVLRQRIASDETLIQLNGGPMDTKKIAPPIRYSRIMLRNNVSIPGVGVPKAELLNVDGRPHAGGIDIAYSGKDNSGNQQTKPGIVTVPWWQVLQANRVTEVEE